MIETLITILYVVGWFIFAGVFTISILKDTPMLTDSFDMIVTALMAALGAFVWPVVVAAYLMGCIGMRIVERTEG